MPLNIYGDKKRVTQGAHGSNISSQRIDELDQLALDEAARLTTPVCVDLGCGDAAQSQRLNDMGCTVHAYDITPPAYSHSLFHFHGGDLSLPPDWLPEKTDLAYSQRFIHFLPYPAALSLLRHIAQSMRPDAKIFLSASGLPSELSQGYGDVAQTIADRFHPLDP